jgi:uncharacterized repeat protein (TIGR02543 family)
MFGGEGGNPRISYFNSSEGAYLPLDSAGIYIKEGDDLSVSIQADEGFTINTLKVKDEVKIKDTGDSEYSFILKIDKDYTIEVLFNPLPIYKITFDVGKGGGCSLSNPTEVFHGYDIGFFIWADLGYVIDLLIVDGEEEDITEFHEKRTGWWSIENITADIAVKIVFKHIGEPEDTVTIKADAGPNGSIFPNSEIKVERGSDQEFFIKADNNYGIYCIEVDGVPYQNADRTFMYSGEEKLQFTEEDISEDRVLIVTFKYIGPLEHWVTFNSDGGTPVGTQVIAHEGFAVRPTDPAKTDHRFDNWYTAGGAIYDFSTPVTESITLKARWIANSGSTGGGGGTTSYTVTFDSNGGSAVASSTVAANTKVAKPADPTKEGYIFDGWFAASDLNAEYNFDTPVTKSFTLYAKWEKDEDGGEDDDFPFTDVAESAWYYEYIKSVYELGLMNGTSDTLFSPAMPVTRGMLVTVLHRMEDTPEVEEPASFSDVSSGTWYTDAVAGAEAEEIVEGYPDGTFKPNQNVSRQELATVLLRYAKFIGKDQFSASPDDPVIDDDESEADEEEIEAVTAIISDDLDFADAAKIADWAKEGVAFCAKNGIIEGRTGKIFDPAAFATRAEFATMLHRFIENVVN